MNPYSNQISTALHHAASAAKNRRALSGRIENVDTSEQIQADTFRRISAGACKVLLALRTFPQASERAALCSITGYSDRQARAILAELREAGLIDAESTDQPATDLVASLKRVGFTAGRAKALATEYPDWLIRAALNQLNAATGLNNPPGFITAWLRENAGNQEFNRPVRGYEALWNS
jgi:hypothetical protein